MAGPADLNDLAVAVLAAAAASMDEAAPATEAPDRQLVAYGVPIDEGCGQLAVHVNPVAEKQTRGPAGTRHRRAWLNQVTFTITTSRCVPTITVVNNKPVLPPVSEIDAASRVVQTDGWALWNGMHNRAEDLFGGCSDVEFGPLTARTPSGGRAGWTLDIRVVLNGYQPAGS